MNKELNQEDNDQDSTAIQRALSIVAKHLGTNGYAPELEELMKAAECDITVAKMVLGEAQSPSNSLPTRQRPLTKGTSSEAQKILKKCMKELKDFENRQIGRYGAIRILRGYLK